jgi:hypothetical protein
LDKAKADGLISNKDSIIFPITERIPKPPSGYWVMFLAFLFRRLSLPTHEFLRGLIYIYGVQLHQLTPNSILHIAYFVTLCESFLGVEPHFLLWRSIFRLHPNVSLSHKPELGEAVVSVRAEAQYLEFSMSASVQGWRTKWFYIKDCKASSEDEYGLAPFDASKELKKLASWNSPPTDAEMKEIAPLLDRIQALKGGRGGALLGIQLNFFFVQRRVQPLQHRLSKLWSYSGLIDSSRVSGNLIEKQDVDKRVRNLTKLTKDHAVADLAAHYFDSEHPLPKVCFLCVLNSCFSHHLPAVIWHASMILLTYFFCRIISSLFHALPFQRRGLFRQIWLLLFPKPPRLKKIRMEMMLKYRKMRRARRRCLLLHFLKILLLIRKGNVLKSSLLRVPLSRELRPVKPLFKKMI